MKAVMPAAGAATRLRPLTDRTPKCLLSVGGRSLLLRSIDHLIAGGLEELVLIVGYQASQIRDTVQREYPGLLVRYVTNASYESTNNAYSLLLARPYVDGLPFLLLDSDLVYDLPALQTLIEKSAGGTRDVLLVRTTGEFGAEEMKVRIEESGKIVRIGKDLPLSLATGESVGIEVFSSKTSGQLFETLADRMAMASQQNEFYEATFQAMIDEGLVIQGVRIPSHHVVMEIDTLEDLQRAERWANR